MIKKTGPRDTGLKGLEVNNQPSFNSTSELSSQPVDALRVFRLVNRLGASTAVAPTLASLAYGEARR